MPLSAHRPDPPSVVSPRQRLSLRLRMAALVTGTMLPLILFSTGVVYFNHMQAREAAFDRVVDKVHGIRLALDAEMNAISHALEVLAGSNALARDDFDAFRNNVAAFLRRYPGTPGISLANRDGTQIFNSRNAPGAPLPRRVNVDVIEQVFTTGKPAFSNLTIGSVTRQNIILVSVPVFRDGEIVHELSFSVPLQKFLDIIQQQFDGGAWTISIFDRSGVSFARVPNSVETFGQKASPTLLPVLLQQTEAKLITTSLEGVPLVTAFTRSPLTGWTVAAGTPVSALTAELWKVLAVTASIGILLLAIGLAFAIRMAARIARSETLLALMVNEVNHRVKNMFATVQAIAAQTLRNATDPREAALRFDARLQALAHTHDVLGQGRWQSAKVKDIVQAALAPFRPHESRLKIAGPDLRLSARAALMTSMVLHELATNAAKYGALSNAEGKISVTWLTPDDGQTMRLTWTESDGPPVAPPAEKGFGSRLIETGFSTQLQGRSVLDFKPGGVTCTLECRCA